MKDKQGRVGLRVDGYTRACLTVIAVLLSVLIVGLWAEVPSADRAYGQVRGIGTPGVNAGQQRERMIKAIEANTAKLDRLTALFESGKAKVQVAGEGKQISVRKPKAK